MTPRTFASLLLLAIATPVAAAAEPLPVRIDRLIEAKAKADGVPLSATADDAEFLRRTTLDFRGGIPTAAEARAFLADASPNKREKLIDSLLANAEFPKHFANRLHVMYMERLGDSPEWIKYLHDSVAANKPWDQVVREVVRADAKNDAARGASFFIAKRLENYGQNPVDYSALTRDVGRLLLGKNLQCAECHDHLFIDEYKQAHFQGLHSFLKNTMLVDAKTARVGEKPTLEKTKFQSVFTGAEMITAPALPGGRMIEVPSFAKGQEYAEVPDRKTNNPGVPKFSTLAALAEELPTAKNRDFVRNAVNRFWFLMTGRGIVHPLDLHHAGNPPSHPELLELLADEFVAHKFDVKWLLREIAQTQTYQRSSVLPPNAKAAPHAKSFATAQERRLSAEQLFSMVGTATGNPLPETLRAKFAKAFANQPREAEEEVEPSLKAALFVLHDDSVLSLLKPKSGNLVERATALPNDKIAEELYLAILTRKPTPAEAETVTAFLAKRADKKADAVGKLAWALLASMEFGVNH